MKKLKFLMSTLTIVSVVGCVGALASCSCNKPVDPTPQPTQTYTISLSAGEHGTVDKTTVSVKKGTKFGDAVKNVVCTPESGYAFDKWVDKDGVEISDDTQVTSNMTAKATFVVSLVTEPTNDADREATGVPTVTDWREDKFLYTYTFPGVFTTMWSNVENIVVSGTMQYNKTNDIQTFQMSGGVTKLTNNTFKCYLTYAIDNTHRDMLYVPNNTQLAVTNITFNHNGEQFVCKKNYKADVKTTITHRYNETLEFDCSKRNEQGRGDLNIFNPEANLWPATTGTKPIFNWLDVGTFAGGIKEQTFTYENNGVIQFKDFYITFNTNLPAEGTTQIVGFKITDGGETTYFEKAKDAQPEAKFIVI